ncbi:MAG: 6,7-dimethyl-8-ribityllumazine synthase [Myxococcota bacterium]|nr:6,7-dimethyl-8-ribityllumazine synthase [Myxococcota bacterium]
MTLIEGSVSGEGQRFALIVARFNHFVTEPLLKGALAALKEHGVSDEAVTVVRVPGTFELPPVASRLARSGRFDALIAIGAVIRGGTPHFEYVAGEAAKGTADVAMSSGLPVAFGILTCDDVEQALERAGEGASNKGWEAALAALEMADLHRKLGAAGL